MFSKDYIFLIYQYSTYFVETLKQIKDFIVI